ncbi:MAG: pitrilysin family protein [Chitinophagales bacterium]|nr:insulinase family protein [Chitinophagales bacterium]MDW8393305.1 pitrilysin family protein [Chitinophagales bacterium]
MRQWFKPTAPPLQSIERIDLLQAHWQRLGNGVGICRISCDNQPITKMEWLFRAGRYQEPKRAVASAAAGMLLDGTPGRSQQEIADYVEYYGATLQADAFADYASLTLYALPRYVKELVPLMTELITEAVYPEAELSLFCRNRKQRLFVELQRVEFLAQRAFQQRLYGEGHPLGYAADEADYDGLSSEDLQAFRARHYGCGPFFVLLSGAVDDAHVQLLEQTVGALPGVGEEEGHGFTAHTQTGPFRIAKDDALQAALRIGKRMVNRLHPDFSKLLVVNTLLGGFFGSRLMQNLREEHGFCYGVHSSLVSFRHDAHLIISTEVGREVATAAVEEIYREIHRLRKEPVEAEELMLVKNYLMGAMLADTDGALNTADVYRGLILYGQSERDFAERIRQLLAVTAEEVQRLAQDYLDPEQMVEVAAGI